MLINIISFIIFILYGIKALDFIYLFQIKEYRFDRFLAMFSDESILNIFYIRPFRFPAKSLRNILIVIFAIPLVYYNFSLVFSVDIPFLIIYLFFLPFFSLSTVILGVFITEILARIKRQQLIERARETREESGAIFIGITGSYGKSTTKEFLYHFLSKKYATAKTDANQNTDVGVAISILNNLKKETEIFIAEMGAYRRGEIKRICDLVKPKYAIVTAIGNQHLELFGSRKNLIESKKEIIHSLPKQGKAYVNLDLRELDLPDQDICWFSANKKTDIYASQIKTNGEMQVKIAYGNENLEIKTCLSKEYLINLLPAIALALDLKVSKESIIESVGELKPLDAKLALKKSVNGSCVLDDSYNSSHEGFLLAIKTAAKMRKKKIIVLSRGLIELGTEKKGTYKNIISQLKQKDINLYTTDRLFADVAKSKLVINFKNEREMLKQIKNVADPETLLVIEGKFPEKFVKNLIL